MSQTLQSKLKSPKRKNVFMFLFLPLFLITLTSGVYRHDQPIEKYLALANREQFNCVGEIIGLKDNNWKGKGSFVLIDSVTILTAAHCFFGELKKDTIVNYRGQKFNTFIVTGKYQRDLSEFRFKVMNTILKAKSILLHPGYLKDESGDLALIKLETPVRGIKELNINSSFDEMHDTVTGVGFGVSGPGNKPELVNDYHIKIAGQNTIDSIGGQVLNAIGTRLYADFDSPDKKEGCNKMGSATPLELEYTIGAGDSGGPLFSYKDHRLCLTGIAVYGSKTVANLLKNGYYCELTGWLRVSAFAGWIKSNR